ncbi:MAG: hypothetical protein V4726_00765 [Verrucomicrobiota bacterium]
MKITLIALSAGVLGALMSFVILRPAAEPAPAAAAKPGVVAFSDAKVRALTQEVAQLKARLAAKAAAETPPRAEAGRDSKAAIPESTDKAREKIIASRRESIKAAVAAKVEKLTEKLALNPDQATAVTIWHQSHQEAVLAAALKTPRDPKDYRLNMAYRQDLPPEVLANLPEEQQAVWLKHDADARADSVESITNGEMGFIASTLDLSREQKDQLFPHLSQLYMEDTYADFANVVDIDSLSVQKDADNERRRQFYSKIFDAGQMEKWESIAVTYKDGMLRQYGPPKPGE